MALDSMQEIFEKAAAEQIPFWKVVLETDVEQLPKPSPTS